MLDGGEYPGFGLDGLPTPKLLLFDAPDGLPSVILTMPRLTIYTNHMTEYGTDIPGDEM